MRRIATTILVLLLSACRTPAPTGAPVPATATQLLEPTAMPLSPTAVQSPTPMPSLTPLPPLQQAAALQVSRTYMFDASTGWGISADGRVIRTVNGAAAWQDVTPPQGAYQEGGFFALDGETAWATPYIPYCEHEACHGPMPRPNFTTIWRTSDGGATWQGQDLCIGGGFCGYAFGNSPSFLYANGLQFLDANTGWLLLVVNYRMSQSEYRVYRTMDGGVNWTMTVNHIGGPILGNATGIAWLDFQEGFLAHNPLGGASSPDSTPGICISLDGGFDWKCPPLPAPEGLPPEPAEHPNWCGTFDLRAAPPQGLDATVQCWVNDRYYSTDLSVNAFFTYHSVDGGESWISWPVAGYHVLDPVTGFSELMAGSSDFVGAVGWRLDPAPSAELSQLQKTVDGGLTWTTIKSVTWQAARLDFVDELTGWAVAISGDQTALLRTTDGGVSWQDLSPVVAGP